MIVRDRVKLAIFFLSAILNVVAFAPSRAYSHRFPTFLHVSEETLTWQEGIEKIFSPKSSQAERQILLQDLVARRTEVTDDITRAISNGTPEDLLPQDSDARRAVDGARAVQRQVVDDILPAIAEEAPRVPGNFVKNAPEIIASAAEAVQKKLTPDSVADAARRLPDLPQLLADEALNVVSSVPPGLQSPDYTVVDRQAAFEIRDYAPYSTCTAAMAGSEDPFGAGTSFNTLAEYTFGENDSKESLSMTTPVAISRGADGSQQMSFVLPGSLDASSAPAPISPRVILSDVPTKRVAAVEFPGFATDGEVSRVLSALQQELRLAGLAPVEDGVYTLLQYNPPYTLPFLRKNEIIIDLATEAVNEAEIALGSPDAPDDDALDDEPKVLQGVEGLDAAPVVGMYDDDDGGMPSD